jgi:hypothetical protein
MSDKEKAKSKGHPFAGMLNPEEEIVWMATFTRPNLWKIIKSKLWMYKVLFLIFILAAVITALTQPDPYLRINQWFLVFLGMMILQTILFAPVIAIQWLYRRYHRHERFYAVTNERVLYRIKGMTRSLPLKLLPYIDVFSVDEGGHWGAYYPMWLNDDDIQCIRRLKAEVHKQNEKEA